jgi:hypothetical protein
VRGDQTSASGARHERLDPVAPGRISRAFRAIRAKGTAVAFTRLVTPSTRRRWHSTVLLGWIALAAPFGLAACCPDSLVDDVYLIGNPDAATQALIDACRGQGPQACLPLCRKVTGMQYTTFEHCEVHPDRDGYVQVHVGYHEVLGCL